MSSCAEYLRFRHTSALRARPQALCGLILLVGHGFASGIAECSHTLKYAASCFVHCLAHLISPSLACLLRIAFLPIFRGAFHSALSESPRASFALLLLSRCSDASLSPDRLP